MGENDNRFLEITTTIGGVAFLTEEDVTVDVAAAGAVGCSGAFRGEDAGGGCGGHGGCRAAGGLEDGATCR